MPGSSIKLQEASFYGTWLHLFEFLLEFKQERHHNVCRGVRMRQRVPAASNSVNCSDQRQAWPDRLHRERGTLLSWRPSTPHEHSLVEPTLVSADDEALRLVLRQHDLCELLP